MRTVGSALPFVLAGSWAPRPIAAYWAPIGNRLTVVWSRKLDSAYGTAPTDWIYEQPGARRRGSSIYAWRLNTVVLNTVYEAVGSEPANFSYLASASPVLRGTNGLPVLPVVNFPVTT